MLQVVHQDLTDEVLQKACSLYDMDFENIVLLRSNSNLVYAGGNKILRLSHESLRSAADIAVEVDWLRFLKEEECSVAAVLPSKRGCFQETIKGSKQNFVVVAFEKIEGTKMSMVMWTKAHFIRLGELTAQLHQLGNQYEEKADLTYKHWDEIEEFHYHHYLLQEEHGLDVLHNQLVEEFQAYERVAETYGLIHNDIHHGNYLIDANGKIVLFDFESVCKSWYIYDIASVLYYALHVADPPDDFAEYFMASFWLGYEKHAELSVIEKKRIPKFLLYRDLLVLGYLNKIWENTTMEEAQSAYKEKIRFSIAKRRKQLFG